MYHSDTDYHHELMQFIFANVVRGGTGIPRLLATKPLFPNFQLS